MNENIRDTILAVSVVAIVMTIGFGGMFLYSGQTTPYSVVVSGSMQHGNESSVGTIDTGDVVVVRQLSKVGGMDEIKSYVDGYHQNYSKFSEYGDVIIYERNGNKNPVIHRPIVWLDWNESTDSWDAPSLDGFPGWSVTSGNADGTNMTGILTMTDIGFSNKTVRLDLDLLASRSKTDGFATLGDSVGNTNFDQMSGIISTLVGDGMIKYVAGFEIPWIGSIKMYIDGNPNVSQIPSNSIPNLIAFMIGILILVTAVFIIAEEAPSVIRNCMKKKRR